MNLANQHVRFRLRDVYVPDGKELSFQLYADNILHGLVVDASDNEQLDGQYAVIEVDGLDAPVVVPVARLIPEHIPPLLEKDVPDTCNVTSSVKRKVL